VKRLTAEKVLIRQIKSKQGHIGRRTVQAINEADLDRLKDIFVDIEEARASVKPLKVNTMMHLNWKRL